MSTNAIWSSQKGVGSRVLAQSAGPISATGSTSIIMLATIEVPPMSRFGWIEIYSAWQTNNSVNNKTYSVDFNGNSLYSAGFASDLSLLNQVNVINQGDPRRQIATQGNITNVFSPQTVAFTSLNVDTTVPTFVSINGQLANAADVITLAAYRVTLYDQGR